MARLVQLDAVQWALFFLPGGAVDVAAGGAVCGGAVVVAAASSVVVDAELFTAVDSSLGGSSVKLLAGC